MMLDTGSQPKLSERVQIFIHGKDYKSENGSPYVDSYLKIVQSDGKSLSRTVYQSKVCKQNTSPKYTETLILDYFFQKRQSLTFRVFVDNIQFGVLRDIPISHMIQDVKTKERDLLDQHGEVVGKLEIWCERVVLKQARRRFKATVKLLQLEALFQCLQIGQKKVFFKLVRTKEQKNQKNQLTIYQSQAIPGTQGSSWSTIQIEQSKLCQNNDNIEFQLKLFYQSHLEIQIGSITLTLNTIRANQVYKLKMNGKSKAKIAFTTIERSRDQTFLDYLQSGLQIKTAIAIDYTESNGKYQSIESKHHIGNGMSQYEEVMKNLLGVMLEYNSEKKTAILGFGSAVKHPNFNTNNKVSHCFPVKMDPHNLYMQQKNQILQAYRKSLPYLEFAGPTLFAPLLKWSIQQCKRMKDNINNNEYMVLFIMTDGQVCDKQQVQKLLDVCTNLPFSLIVIGIGQEDFSIMNEIYPSDRVLQRNMYKFVEYGKYKRNLRELIDQVLGQIPKHVQKYFALRDQKQRHPRQQQRRIQESSLGSLGSVTPSSQLR